MEWRQHDRDCRLKPLLEAIQVMLNEHQQRQPSVIRSFYLHIRVGGLGEAAWAICFFTTEPCPERCRGRQHGVCRHVRPRVNHQDVVHLGLRSTVNNKNEAISRSSCSTCGGPGPKQRCAGCGLQPYCNVGCQRKQWNQHKEECRFLRSLTALVQDHFGDEHRLVRVDPCSLSFFPPPK